MPTLLIIALSHHSVLTSLHHPDHPDRTFILYQYHHQWSRGRGVLVSHWQIAVQYFFVVWVVNYRFNQVQHLISCWSLSVICKKLLS